MQLGRKEEFVNLDIDKRLRTQNTITLSMK